MISASRYRFDASGLPLTFKQRLELQNLCAVVRRLDARQAVPATSGNFSLRIDANTSFISRSGMHKRNLTPRHFLRVNFEGEPLTPLSPKPSDELAVHSALYELLPEMNCVLHCHASCIESVKSPGEVLPGHELLKILGWDTHTRDLYLNAFANTQDMNALARLIKKVFEGSPDFASLRFGILVLQNHGIYCAGKDVANAEARLEAILHLLEIRTRYFKERR